MRTVTLEPAPYWLAGHEHVVADVAVDATACRGADIVVHLAGPNETVMDGDAAVRATEAAAAGVARAVGASDARVLYVSTVHVYGKALSPGAVITEETTPEPLAAYGAGRLAAEVALRDGLSEGQLTVLRLTNAAGAPVHPDVARWTLVVNDLCRQAVTQKRLVLQSAGGQWRDFVALGEVCRVIEAAIEGRVPPGLYNVASGKPLTIRQIAGMVQDAAERAGLARPPLEAPDPPERPSPAYRLDTTRLTATGVEICADITGAVDETLAFCLEQQDYLPRP